MLILASSNTKTPDFSDTLVNQPFRPIPFPDAERQERARKARLRVAECEAALRDNARVAFEQAIATARQNGRTEGHITGYRAGTHWGMFCGFVLGAFVASMFAASAVVGRAWWLTL